MAAKSESNRLLVFRTRLGWMALVGDGKVVRQLTIAHPSAEAAVAACDRRLLAGARRGNGDEPLVARLRAYAAGEPDEFADVPVDLEPLSDFQRRVVRRCREIPRGTTVSYGQLAAEVGSPGAARAVGNCMAANRIPLIVPCHRVLRADGRLGAYSAPGGPATKRLLLRLEGVACDALRVPADS